MSYLSKLFYFTLSILLFLSCSSSEENSGPNIIHNTTAEWGNTPKVKLEFVRKIGELEGDNENLMFYSPSDIEVDDDGNYYILDGGNFRVQKFDKDLNFISSFGRKGEGPEEFTRGVQYSTFGIYNNSIFVFDGPRIHQFSLEGEFVKTSNLGWQLFKPRITNEGQLLVAPYSGVDDSDPKSIVGLFDLEGNLLNGFGERYEFGNGLANGNENWGFAAINSKNEIYLARRYQNEIEKYTKDGKMIFKMDRELDFDIVKAEYKKYENGAVGVVKGPTQISRGFVIDSKDRLWVVTSESDGKTRKFEIYNSNGELLGELSWDGLPSTGSIKYLNNKIYFFDYLKEMAVYEYKIVELD